MNRWLILIKKIGTGRLLLLLFAGILLIMASSLEEERNKQKTGDKSSNTILNDKTPETADENNSYSNKDYIKEYEEKFEEMIKCMSGVTDVKVMITLKSEGSRVVLKEEQRESSTVNETDSYGGVRVSNTSKNEEEVIYDEDESGRKTPYVLESAMPKIEGVLVIVKGSGNYDLLLGISEAAEVLFGIDAHKIKVLPMK